MAATRESWKTLPQPTEKEHFALTLSISEDALERMMHGVIPEDMSDRWFVFFESGWLYFHRSWTGSCVFGIEIQRSATGAAPGDCWVSRNEAEYTSTDIDRDRDTLTALITRFFIKPRNVSATAQATC